MGKRILISIIVAILIVGIIIVSFISNLTSFNIGADEVVSIKYYMNKGRYENYYTIPNHIEKESIEEIVSVLNESDIEVNKKITTMNDSDRKLYVFLENKDVIIINNNIMDQNKYVVELPNDSILRNTEISKYAVINSERLKNVFLNIENFFKNENDSQERMKI